MKIVTSTNKKNLPKALAQVASAEELAKHQRSLELLRLFKEINTYPGIDNTETIKKINTLLIQGVNFYRDDSDKIAIHIAVSIGNNQLVNTLLDHGADINCTNYYGETPLHLAATYGNVQLVNTLLKRGANVNAINKDENTPLHIAITYGNDVELVNMLLEHKANVNAKNNDQETPLHLAASGKKTELVKILIENKADINALNSISYTPYTLANGDKEVQAALLQAGANVNHGNTNYREEQPEPAPKIVTKDCENITNLIKKSRGWIYDNENNWQEVNNIISSLDSANKITVVTQVLNETNNTSRRNRLLNFLSEDEINKVKPNIKPIETLWQKLLKLAGYSKPTMAASAEEISKIEADVPHQGTVPISSALKEQARQIIRRHSTDSATSLTSTTTEKPKRSLSINNISYKN